MPSNVRVVLKRNVVTGLTYGAPMTSFLMSRAQSVVAAARSRSPRDTGRYASSFRIGWASTDRNVVRVYNDAPYALRVEFGGSQTAKRRTLGTALDASGGDVRVYASRSRQKAHETRRRNARAKRRRS